MRFVFLGTRANRLALIVLVIFACAVMATVSARAFENNSPEVGVLETSPAGPEGGYAIPASGSSIACSTWREDNVDPWPVNTPIKLYWSGSGVNSTMSNSATIRSRRNGGSWTNRGTQTSGWSYTPTTVGNWEFEVTAQVAAGTHSETTCIDLGKGGSSCSTSDVTFYDSYTCTETLGVYTPPPPPTNMNGSCSADGKTGTFSWTAPGGYNTFYTRARNFDGTDIAAAYDNNFVGTLKTFPTTPGQSYWWWIHTKDTTNGSWSTQPTGGVINCPTPDLVSQNFAIVGTTSTSITIVQNTALTFSAQVRNTGPATVSSSFTDIFQYSSNGGSTWQTLSTPAPVASLAVNGTANETSGTFNPASQGPYLVRHCVDQPGNAVLEGDEGNNCSTPISVTVVGPVTASCAPAPLTSPKNTPVSWSAVGGGGVGGYSYVWSGAASGMGSPRVEQYATAGSKTVYVTAIDSLGFSSGAVMCTNLTVNVECADGIDNADAEDTLIDYPNDPGCANVTDDDEGNIVNPDLTAVSTGPAAGASFANPASITFTGTITNSNAVTLAGQNVWADVEVDWNQANCAAAASEQSFNAGGPWTSVEVGGTRPMSATLTAANSQLRNGTHCYRMIADRGGLVTESNDANNASAWRAFTVSSLPQCSDGVDNADTEDVLVDYPADLGCTDDADNDETDAAPLPDLRAVTNAVAGSPFNNPASITFTGTIQNFNNPTAAGQNVWADVEVDWNQANCAAAASEQSFNAGGPWSAVAAGWTQPISATLSKASAQLRNGTHCYRMIADRGGLVAESDNNNNGGAWTSFTVSNLPQCSDGINNDADALIDFPNDPGCSGPDDNDETDVAPLPNLSAINTIPAAGATFTSWGATTGITFTGRASNSNGPTVNGTNFWADVEVDWNQGNCAAAVSEFTKTSGGAWNNVPNPWGPTVLSATLSRTAGELRNGTHCYRMVVDRDDFIAETTNADNGAAWRSFTVSNLPQCSDGVDNADIDDSLADFGSDPDCSSPDDNDETATPGPTASLQSCIMVSGAPTNCQSGTRTFDAGQTIGLVWTSANADSCSAVDPQSAGFSTANAQNGTDDTINEPTDPATPYSFSVVCYQGATPSPASTVVIDVNPTAGGAPTLSANPARVGSCQDTTLTAHPQGNAGCTVTGPGVSTSLTDLNNPTTISNVQVCGESTYTLHCPSPYVGSDKTVTVRIDPSLEER